MCDRAGVRGRPTAAWLREFTRGATRTSVHASGRASESGTCRAPIIALAAAIFNIPAGTPFRRASNYDEITINGTHIAPPTNSRRKSTNPLRDIYFEKIVSASIEFIDCDDIVFNLIDKSETNSRTNLPSYVIIEYTFSLYNSSIRINNISMPTTSITNLANSRCILARDTNYPNYGLRETDGNYSIFTKTR